MKFNNKFRLIITQNLSSNVNSNIDKALFKSFENNSFAILRIYSWQDSITFGAGQNIEDYILLKQKYKNNVSKRLTGGGVLFHGHDLSYTIVLNPNMIENRDVKETYFLLCQFLIRFYENLGLKASFAKDNKKIILSKSPFCQVGFEAYDIIVDGNKIGGNAQKRNKKLIFQHGSIPILKTKEDKRVGISLEDLDIHLSFEEAQNRLIKAFEECFDAKLILSQLSQIENENLKKILEGK